MTDPRPAAAPRMGAAGPSVPATRREPVVDMMHGVPVPDPYRWLEDGSAAEVRAWTDAQNAHTAAVLGAVPARPALRARLEQLLRIGSIGTPQPLKGRYLFQRRDGEQDQPVLVLREGVAGPERVVLDPVALDPSGTTALDWYHPSDDGRYLAYGLSSGGTEQSVLHLLDLDTGAPLPDTIPHTRACDLAWLPDRTGFYYTRYPAPGEVPAGEETYHRAIWFHRLGDDPAADRLVFRPEAREHWPGVSLSDDGRWLVISVARTFDQTDLYLQDRVAAGPLVPVVVGEPGLVDAHVLHGRLFVRTNRRAPTYGLYDADPADPSPARWRTLVPPREGAVLVGFAVTREHLVLEWLERATSRLERLPLGGGTPVPIALPGLGTVSGLGAEHDGDELLFGFTSFTTPPSIFRLDLATGTDALWARVEADVEPSAYEVEQVEVRSRDGTPVTMFVVHRADLVKDGNRPTYLTGYGGFNIAMTPGFSRSQLLWIERGGVLAIPNLRGGGEYGEAWHQDGMLANKQHTFDDCIAAAEWLVAEGWTRPGRLALAGGSNGGLLVGAVITQRPDLVAAAIIQVPLLDMVRYHKFLIARLWIPEYGDPDDPAQFRWLHAYSPYHHVREGERYPAVLLATGEGDTRVDPLHARKMCAALQHASTSGRPVLLRLEPAAGHGAGKPVRKVLDELTDSWSFVWEALGLEG